MMNEPFELDLAAVLANAGSPQLDADQERQFVRLMDRRFATAFATVTPGDREQVASNLALEVVGEILGTRPVVDLADFSSELFTLAGALVMNAIDDGRYTEATGEQCEMITSAAIHRIAGLINQPKVYRPSVLAAVRERIAVAVRVALGDPKLPNHLN